MEAIPIQTTTLLALESKDPHPPNHPQAQDGCVFFFVDPSGLSLVLLVFLLLTKMLINEMTVISFLGVL